MAFRQTPGHLRDSLIGLLFTVALFAGGEVALRAAGLSYPPLEIPLVIWNPKRDSLMRNATSLHRVDRDILWTPRGGARIPWAPGETVSLAGFRGADPDPQANVRLLTLGDSSTFGMGVDGPSTYSARLERALRDRLADQESPGRNVQVLNGGIIGATVRQGLERYRQVRRVWADDPASADRRFPQIVIAAFGAVNEYFPAGHFTDDEKIAELRRRDGRLWQWLKDLRAESRFAHGIAWLADQAQGGRAAIIDRLAAAARLQARTHRDRTSTDYVRRVSVAEFRRHLGSLQAAIHEDGGTLILLSMPRRQGKERELALLREYDEALASFAREQAVLRVNGRAIFLQQAARGTLEDDLFVDAWHPTAKGHALLAGTLLDPVLDALDLR